LRFIKLSGNNTFWATGLWKSGNTRRPVKVNAARQTAEFEKEGKDRPGAPRYNFGILPFLASRKTEGKSQQVK
jgi:hypothetical protein